MALSCEVGTMQLHFNLKNISVAFVGFFFVYLTYALWFRTSSLPDLTSSSDIFVDLSDLLSYCVLATEIGGGAVVAIHAEKRLQAESKGDTEEGAKQFVTRADLISNHLMLEALRRFPGLKIVSEERSSMAESNVQRYKQAHYPISVDYQSIIERLPKQRAALKDITVWIDPLDATQEYTENLVEYVTVMACIAVNGIPKIGVIHRPFQNETVWAVVGHGVYPSAYSGNGAASNSDPVIVVSRSHAGAVEPLAKSAFSGAYRVEAAGGAGYKVLRVANRTAAFYLHQTAIKKWDVCAGDALLRAAGGRMLTLLGDSIDYGAAADGETAASVKNADGLLATLTDPFTLLEQIKKARSTSGVSVSNS